MSIQSSKKLFSPLKVGDITLNHRIVMPPISRLRANWPNAIPSNMMLEHYSQRATEGGLIIAEATAVSAEARAYHTAPGLYTDEQVLGWKRITDVVHEKKGVIFVQLSHAGRATNALLTEGKLPITASVNQEFLQNKNIVVSTPNGFELPSEHRALQTNEIPNVIEQFRYAAENAKNAGFDGIEIQAGQGHIIEQFLQNKSNNRIDEYGGSIENRVRLLTEILESTISVWGQNRVGVRISPSSTFNGMGDSDPRALFRYLASRMNNYALAYLHIIEPRISGADTIAENQDAIATKELRGIYEGIMQSTTRLLT
jgi:N-ethylmaleimide reductase